MRNLQNNPFHRTGGSNAPTAGARPQGGRKMKTHYDRIRFFDDEDKAIEYMTIVNNARLASGNNHIFVLTDGPEDNWAVVEMEYAIDNGFAFIS